LFDFLLHVLPVYHVRVSSLLERDDIVSAHLKLDTYRESWNRHRMAYVPYVSCPF